MSGVNFKLIIVIPTQVDKPCNHGHPHIGANGSADPLPLKIDEKLKSENMKKEQFSMFMLYFENKQGRQV